MRAKGRWMTGSESQAFRVRVGGGGSSLQREGALWGCLILPGGDTRPRTVPSVHFPATLPKMPPLEKPQCTKHGEFGSLTSALPKLSVTLASQLSFPPVQGSKVADPG